MDFSKVDDAFDKWAKSLGISIQTNYKGEEVRSVDLIDGLNKKWQLWLVPINESAQCVIHYWNYKDISRHATVNNSELDGKLYEIGQNILSGSISKAHLP